ncbi:hypothetical protein [Chitinimonas koreensis]|uniref:hypothetical protein n=1 Tax=Chitinimonas koreensis TaxID=356302 RepID=UPI0012FA2EC2|nr:hypothetical protein [Chitinimonas koreensis]QNM95440.1 hypothetical protein H9L41_16425 [Chitinimonas koreensis]
MKRPTFQQVAVAFWISAAVVLAVLSRTWSAAAVPLAAGFLMMAPGLAARGRTSINKTLRVVSGIVQAVWWVSVAMIVVGGAERLYYINGATYPRWLITGELQQLGIDGINQLRATECRGRFPVEVTRKEDGYLVRCGVMWWDSKTYFTVFDPAK